MNLDEFLKTNGIREEHLKMLQVMKKIPNVSTKMLRARSKISDHLFETYIADLEHRQLASRFTLVKKQKSWTDSIELTKKGEALLEIFEKLRNESCSS